MKALVCLVVLLTFPALAANMAIIDSGVDYKHKDLVANMWTNPYQQTTDVDGNKYVDDTHGWNFAENNNQIIDYSYLGTFPPDCKKMFDVQAKILSGTATAADKAWYTSKKQDANFMSQLETFGNFVHGTHVSGIASKDNPESHIVGIKLIPTEPPKLPTKAPKLDEFLFNNFADRVRSKPKDPMLEAALSVLAKQQSALLTTVGKYTAAVNAAVANASWGTSVANAAPLVKTIAKSFFNEDLTDAQATTEAIYFINQVVADQKDFVAAASKTLFAIAAGNDGTDNDSLPAAPANVKADNTITVAASYGVDSLATFSNYGATMVEVAAPGVIITSTIPGDDYLALSGTSMAAPFVTNVAEAVVAANPSLTPAQVKQILISTVDVKSFLQGKVSSSGIVNRDRAVAAAQMSTSHSLTSAIRLAKTKIADVAPTFKDSVHVDEKDLIVFPLRSPF